MRRISTDFKMTKGARASFDGERQEDLKTEIFLSPHVPVLNVSARLASEFDSSSLTESWWAEKSIRANPSHP
jgi:hypothetical protein